METVKLEMNFQDALEKTFKLSIEDPRADMDESEIQDAMSNIITNNIFDSKGVDLANAKSARFITTSIDEMIF